MIRDTSGPGVMQLVLSLVPGGTERLTVEIAVRLSRRFRMAVCCLDEPGAWAEQVTAAGVPVIALHRQPGFRPSLGWRIAGLASEMNLKVLHCHHFSPFVYGSIAAMVDRRLALVYTEHGRLSDAPPTLKRKIVNSVLSRLAGPSFAVAHDLRRHMIAEGFKASRLGVVHNGIEIPPRPDAASRAEARRLLGAGEDAIVVGTVARLDPVKDFGTLIEAVALARQRIATLELVVIGDGPEEETLRQAIRRVGGEQAIRLFGYSSQVRTLLPGFDIYANSSISEGISLTILEAMAAGLPVVATRVGGTPEVIVEGQTGLMVPPRAPEALAAALVELAGRAERRRALGEAGRARVESAFAIERMIDDYGREYERLL
jgi:glycosyltransferase involved in cell wall biosynthesis